MRFECTLFFHQTISIGIIKKCIQGGRGLSKKVWKCDIGEKGAIQVIIPHTIIKFTIHMDLKSHVYNVLRHFHAINQVIYKIWTRITYRQIYNLKVIKSFSANNSIIVRVSDIAYYRRCRHCAYIKVIQNFHNFKSKNISEYRLIGGSYFEKNRN